MTTPCIPFADVMRLVTMACLAGAGMVGVAWLLSKLDGGRRWWPS